MVIIDGHFDAYKKFPIRFYGFALWEAFSSHFHVLPDAVWKHVMVLNGIRCAAAG